MAPSTSSTKRILILLAQRGGSVVGLALAISLARGFWDSALQAFSEGVLEGFVAVLLALVVTAFALVIVYATLGSQVEQVVVRLIALAAGRVTGSATRSEITAAAWADLLATPAYAAVGVMLVAWGVSDAHATWTLLGFAGLSLSLFSLTSAAAHFLYRRLMTSRDARGRVDEKHAEKGGEIAGVFVSIAVLSLTLSASLFASIPAYRFRGARWNLAYGDWARVCVGAADGCVPKQIMTFEPEARGATLLEVVSKEQAILRARGAEKAVDAAGKPVRLVREKGSEYSWQATFVPASRTTYEVLLETPGSYSVRFRSAP